MAIGNVALTGTPQQYQQPRIPEAAFGAGVGQAIDRLAQATDNYADSKLALEIAANEEQKRAKRFDVTTRWTTLQGELAREQVDYVNNAPEDGQGMTDARFAQLQDTRKKFLDSIDDPDLRAEFEADTEAFVQNMTTSTYGEEFKLRTNFENTQIEKAVSSLSTDIANGDSTMEAAQAQLDEILATTRLSEADKVKLRDAGYYNLGAAQFQAEIKRVMSGRGTVREATGEDVVAAGLMPWERGFLNATAAKESSNRYNIRYDGGAGTEFTDFSDHPRVFVPGPEGPSSAAGRYQITASTWDYLVGKYGRDVLPDFSPESQDRAALLLARERFNSQVDAGGWDFDTILSRGTDEQIIALKDALSPTWTAFKTMSNDEFLNIFRGGRGVAGGGTGAGNMPDVFTDPRFADIPYENKVQMASDAGTAVKQMQEATEASRQATADMLKGQFAAGRISGKEIQAAIDANAVPMKEVDALYNLIKDDMKGEREAARFSAAADAGIILGNGEDNQKAAFEYYRRSGVLDAMSAGDPTAAGVLATGFAKTGVMPKQIGEMLQSMVNSNNPNQVSYAMDTLSAMRAKNPDMFAFALPKELVELEGAWNIARKYAPAGSDAQIMEDFNAWRSPEGQQTRALYEKDIKEQLQTITPDTLMSNFDTWFGWQPEAPVNQTTRAMLKQDFDALYRKYYPLYKDQDKTTEFVVSQMQHSWQPDETGGTKRLMYLGPSAPASGYPTVDGSYNWVRQDILKAMDWPEDKEFSLVSDAQSEGDVARGNAASYLIVQPTETGWGLVMDPNNPGQPMRFRPTITKGVAEAERIRKQISVLKGQRDALFGESDQFYWTEDMLKRKADLDNQIAELEGQL